MKYLTLILMVATGLLLPVTGSSQQVLSSGGGNGSGSNIQLSWTIGEPVIETFTGSSVILTQGFHQTKLLVTATDPLQWPGLTLSAYPNPVASHLLIDLKGEAPASLSFSLFDMNGHLVHNGRIVQFPQKIAMDEYSPGTYLLKVLQSGQTPLKTFKIIKE